MPSKILFLWATCGGKAAARGPHMRILGAAAPPHLHKSTWYLRRSRVGVAQRGAWRAAPAPGLPPC
jgi:hypothetical protein